MFVIYLIALSELNGRAGRNCAGAAGSDGHGDGVFFKLRVFFSVFGHRPSLGIIANAHADALRTGRSQVFVSDSGRRRLIGAFRLGCSQG